MMRGKMIHFRAIILPVIILPSIQPHGRSETSASSVHPIEKPPRIGLQ